MQTGKQWKLYKKKYKSLPDWKWIDKTFGSIPDEDSKILEEVKKIMVEKLKEIKDLLEPFLSGSTDFTYWFERKMVTKKDIDNMFDIYKKIMVILWESRHASISNDEKELAAFISKIAKDWDSLTKYPMRLSIKLADGWKKYKKEEEVPIYHG